MAKNTDTTEFPTYSGPTRPRSRRTGIDRQAPPAPVDGPIRAGAVERLSTAVEANRGNIPAQAKRNDRDAGREGWQIVEHFAGDGERAFDRDTPWPGFVWVREQIIAGVINAVVAVALDRFTRNVREINEFCDLCEKYGVRRLLIGGALYDPVTQRMALTILSAVADEESRIKRDRAIRKAQQLAHDGKPRNGRRPYGYEKGGLVIVPEEAEVIREMMRRALGGAPIAALARDLNSRGIKSATGSTWTSGSLRQILWGWRIAGISSLGDAPIAQAQWPAIVERSDVEAFRSMSGSYKQRRGRPPSLLSKIVRCECHGYLGTSHGDDYYITSPKGTKDCSIYVRKCELDEWVSSEFLLAIRERRYMTEAQTEQAKRLATIETALAAVRSKRERLIKRYSDVSSTMSEEAFEKADYQLGQQESKLLGQAAECKLAPTFAGLEGVEHDWSKLSDSERRKALDILVKEVVVSPHPFREFDPEQHVRIGWRF